MYMGRSVGEYKGVENGGRVKDDVGEEGFG